MELQENVIALKSAVKIILSWDSDKVPANLNFPGHEFDEYLQAVDEIQQLMKSGTLSDSLIQAIDVTQIAMAGLLMEFRNILSRRTDIIKSDTSTSDPSSTIYSSSISDNLSYDLRDREYVGYGSLSKKEIYNLGRIAETLKSAGYVAECIEVYKSSRKFVVEANLGGLGIYNLSSKDIVRFDAETLAKNTKLWIRAANVCVRIIFAGEKQLYEQIFAALGTATYYEYFLETVTNAAIQLLNFADALSTSRPMPQNLFKILDLYKSLLLLLPDINAIFHSNSSEPLPPIEPAEMMRRLVKLVQRMLADFENAVLNELSDAPHCRGSIDHLTVYVVGYMTWLVDYKETLVELIKSKPSTSLTNMDDMEFVNVEGRIPLALHLIWIIVILKFKLQAKCRGYKYVHLGNLFMMNNVGLIVEKIEGSPEMQEMVGVDYFNKLSQDALQAAVRYHRMTLDRALYCLRDKGLHYGFPFYHGVSKSALKQRFKNFNAEIDKLHRTQSALMVPHWKRRDQLRQLILEALIPAYRSFLHQFMSHFESEKHPDRYIKYSITDLENLVLNFFQGYG